MKAFAVLVFMVILSSCGSTGEWVKKAFEPKSDYEGVHLNHQAFARQRFIPRKGYEGYLTNRVCLEFYGNECKKTSIVKYDLKDAEVRKKFNDFKIACKVGGKRYRICKDQAGLCRSEEGCLEWKKHWLTRKRFCAKRGVIKTDFIPVENYQYLLDGATECKEGY